MNLAGADFLALLPLLVLSAGIVVVMLVTAFHRGAGAVMGTALVVLALALAALPLAAGVAPRQVTPLVRIDDFALAYMGLMFAATFAVALLAWGYFRRADPNHGALYILLLLAALGSAVLASSNHFASFVLGLEMLSVSLFALIAFSRANERSLEAGIKYLILASTSAAFLLFGMALVYAEVGSMAFAQVGERLQALPGGDAFVLAGVALILVGIGFKLALVPFHMWTPDVYQGAPPPIAAFVATVSKGALVAVLMRYFVSAGGYRSANLVVLLSAIAIASMLAGNLLALLQDNVKRILAYSSIAHLGYLLVAFVSAGPLAVEAVNYYLLAYFVAMLGAFGVIVVLSPGALQADVERLDEYRGLFWRRPWLAGVFTAMLLSLAGIPLTMGFVAKFYAVAAGVDASLWLLVIVLVVGSAIGLFYYLRIIAAMCGPIPEPGEAVVTVVPTPAPAGWTLAVLTLLLFWLGTVPGPLIHWLETVVVLRP